MTDLSSVKIKKALVKIVGIFESEKNENIEQLRDRFTKLGYRDVSIPLDEQEKKMQENFIKDYWYPEFRNLWFGKKESVICLRKNYYSIINFIFRDVLKSVSINYFEIYLLPNGLHFFSIIADSDIETAQGYSDLCFLIRNFYSKIPGEGNWVDWIEKNCLDNIQISSDNVNQKVKVDEFSGSKFKLFQVFELEEKLDETSRLRLLYELGAVLKISKSTDIPPEMNRRYMNQMLHYRLSIFSNYDMLPLLDSFTTLGFNILGNEESYKTYNNSYFRIYLQALLLKYNLFRYQSKFNKDDLKLRDVFEDFLNTHNISHISYNFLPNIIYKQIKIAMEIDEELIKFKERIVSLNDSIRETQQRRTNVFLGILGAAASVGSILPNLGYIDKFRTDYLHLNFYVYYVILSILVIFILYLIVWYLYPQQLKSFKKRIFKK